MKTKPFFIVLLALAWSMSLVANVGAHDVDGDGYTNWYDLKRVIRHFGYIGPPWIPEDVNEDGKVNIIDVGLVAKQMHMTPTIIEIRPRTLLVPPQGPGVRYIKALIELPEANVHDIDTASIDLVMPGIFTPEGIFIEGVYSTKILGNVMKAEFKADRLVECLRAQYPDPGLYSVEMTVVGVVLPGFWTFYGKDTVEVRIIE